MQATPMDQARTAQLEQLLVLAQKAGATPARHFSHAVLAFARRHGLDEASVAAGQTFYARGVPFQLTHHGERDPEGATVLLDLGQFAMDDTCMRVAVFKCLLRHNASTPAGVHGIFGVLPNSNDIRLCFRVMLDPADGVDGTSGIEEVVGTAADLFSALSAGVLDFARSVPSPVKRTH